VRRRRLDLDGRGVAVLGAIPSGLPLPSWPRVAVADIEPLVFAAIGLALISFNSAMVTARGFAAKNRYDIDANQEFIALGVADIGAGLLQGFAVSGADSRTAVNDSVGGRIQVTGLVTAGLIVVVLLFLTAPLAELPIAVLAAVLINSALGLFDLESLKRLWRISREEFALSVVTLLGVITVGVLQGVALAIGLALLQLLRRASRPHDAIIGRTPSGGYHDLTTHPDAEAFPGLLIFRFDASLLFFNADHFKTRIAEILLEAPGTRCVLLNAETMPFVDTTGAASLSDIHERLAASGIVLAVPGARSPVRAMLELTGVCEEVGLEHFYPTVDSAVAALTTRRTGEGANR
jgi:MFS superfamily sulfate permease-like transporter